MARLWTLRLVRADGNRIVAAVMRDNPRVVKLAFALARQAGISDRNGEVLEYVPPAVKAGIVQNAPPVLEVERIADGAIFPIAVVNSLFSQDLADEANAVLARWEKPTFIARVRALTQADIDAIQAADETPPP